jgi:triosephosphate isomerase (TIM)
MQKKLIVANWKMNPASLKEAESIWRGTMKVAKGIKSARVIICPPTPYLYLSKKLKGPIVLGAQDVFQDMEGAHTGEVSAYMLKSLGVTYTMVGHSDKRKEGDTNAIINQKITSLLKVGIIPVLCVGENARDESGEYLLFVKEQLHECLQGIPKSQMKNIVITYEPTWSISTNPNAREDTPQDLLEMSIYIRKILSDIFSSQVAKDALILYGGSVNENNSREFLWQGDVDGVLVGHASLSPKNFGLIIASAEKQ